MIVLLFWLAGRISGQGHANERSEAYAVESAKYDAATDLLVTCKKLHGESISLIEYSNQKCEHSDDCSIFASAWCNQ